MLLKLGSKGEDVKKLQQRLNLTADGDFGKLTESAVKGFQSANSLTVDGVVGDKTWAKLFPAPTVQPIPIKYENLKGVIPDNVLNDLPHISNEYGINTPLRMSHFLSQCAHESGGFKSTVENLNYSADGLKATYPSYFPNDLAESYARQPEMIGSRVYADRLGNGSESTKEGYTFRGRGYIQISGKDNYSKFTKTLKEDVVSKPDLVATKYPLHSAGWYFSTKCLTLCDAGATDEVVTNVTKCVNGGTRGLDERKKYFYQYYGLLTK
jgi:putative chitinase